MTMDKRAERLRNERVERGITWLNSKVGEDWPTRIRVDELDLADGQHCVVGQLIPLIFERLGIDKGVVRGRSGFSQDSHGNYIGFHSATDQAGLHSDRACVSRGFLASDSERHNVSHHDLQQRWEVRIGELQREQEQKGLVTV